MVLSLEKRESNIATGILKNRMVSGNGVYLTSEKHSLQIRQENAKWKLHEKTQIGVKG